MGDRTVIVLTEDSVHRLDGLTLERLSIAGRFGAQRFIEVVGADATGVFIRRARRLTVGRLTVGDFEIVLPPPFDSELFVLLVLYALRFDIRRYSRLETSKVHLGTARSDVFLRLMALLMVAEAEHLLHGHVSKSYVRREVLVQGLRGGPAWLRNFARHPADGWYCTVFDQSTDDLSNGLVLSGLQSAVRLLTGEQAGAASTQLFIWRELARPVIPTFVSFEIALRRLNRLTEHYRPALALAKAVTLGIAPRDFFTTGDASLNDLEFSLPLLFEDFLLRLLTPCAAQFGLSLEFKRTNRASLLDGLGRDYREVEPDIVVKKNGRPVGVLDAKFKPRYASSREDDETEPTGRVTNEDIYQLFFYQSFLKTAQSLNYLPRAVILAPILSGRSTTLPEARTIIWREAVQATPNDPSLRVLPVPLDAALKQLRTETEVDVVEQLMPEVNRELRAMSEQ